MPTLAEDITPHSSVAQRTVFDVTLLTGGFDRPYAYGLAMALVAKGIKLEIIGSDEVDSPEMHGNANLRFLNLWPSRSANRAASAKLSRVVKYYARLIKYTAVTKSKIFHILWNNNIHLFDRTLLMLYYKAMGKKIVLTAHNVNQGRRDGNDSFWNRLTLWMQYRLTDHIFVHTQKMKEELIAEFGKRESAITVIRHPINDAFPDTDLSVGEAKRWLGLQNDEKTILCFGRIKPYKGVEHLLRAFQKLVELDANYRLVIAGEVQKGNEGYLEEIKRTIPLELGRGQIILKTQFIPDEEIEFYLKAADVMVLPYNEIFQSGVLFLGYSFGLPVIVTDVGSFKEEIIEGKTGFVCHPSDPLDLARAIETYFDSDLYLDLAKTRQNIKEHAATHHSWAAVAELTRNSYAMLEGKASIVTS